MVLQGMTVRPIPVDFLTQGYRIVGKILVSSSGLVGVINDPNSSYVELKDAQMASLENPGQLIRRFTTATLFKNLIVVACVTRREHLGGAPSTYTGYSTSENYRIYFSTCGYEIESTIEWKGRLEPAALLSESQREFLPAYDNTITSLSASRLCIESPAAMINRKMVDLVGFVPKPPETEEA